MKLKLYQVDAFTNKAFAGNPAAVCPLDEWIPDETMQKIANEMNLAETAFIVPEGKGYRLRWFTPVKEVRLCGHATLATAHVLFKHLNYKKSKVEFFTKSGSLVVTQEQDQYAMSFPSDTAAPLQQAPADNLVNQNVVQWYKGTDDFLAILEDENAVVNAEIDFFNVSKLKSRGLVISATGNEKDFVSRCFYPQYGINEDAATGSAHTMLTPIWAVKLQKNHFKAAQLSPRGAALDCSLSSNRIIIRGNAVTVIEGTIFFEND